MNGVNEHLRSTSRFDDSCPPQRVKLPFREKRKLVHFSYPATASLAPRETTGAEPARNRSVPHGPLNRTSPQVARALVAR